MSLQEFREYVTNSGVNFDGLSDDKKREWRESFERIRQAVPPAGKDAIQIIIFHRNHVKCFCDVISCQVFLC
jgi:hypothetical protein